MNVISRWLSAMSGRYDIILSVMLIVAIFMMILPLPTPLVDVLIAVNLSMSVTLLMIAIYMNRLLDFSAFPSMLLITTLYRLALTISTSRLILLQHDAGEIIFTFGNFVVGGNLAVGIIIYAIITIVQFIVITKGSERVAEVSARFSLDGMPGKQMSIDGDLRAGVIDAKEAKDLRSQLQKESQLYGAMDGAMKFVKGDAIASIIVILTNICGGVAIGMLQNNMSASDAVSTYSILSVGDGLIAQIPSLLLSITAGLMVTRVSGEQPRNLATELVIQISRQPSSLQLASMVMVIFAIIPGFPLFVFGPLAGGLFFASWCLKRKQVSATEETDQVSVIDAASGAAQQTEGDMSPGALPLLISIDSAISAQMVKESLQRLRWLLFDQIGLPLPEIQLQVIKNGVPGQCSILLYQEPVLTLRLNMQEALVPSVVPNLSGRKEFLSFNGRTVCWIDHAMQERARSQNITFYTVEEIPAYLAGWVIERYAAEFIGVQETRYLMDSMEGRYNALVKELQRLLPVGKVAEILQRLAGENISIRDLRTIFETLVEWGPKEKESLMLTEYVRIALRRHIRRKFTNSEGVIPVMMVGERIETMIRESIRQSSVGSYSALDAIQSQQILDIIKENVIAYEQPCALLASLDIRRYLRKIIERDLFACAVLSIQELGDDAAIKIVSSIDLSEEGYDETA
ncbi:MAG: EscV/YscV/HrcV family type III secretion system export apparatus protein [Enterobacteriaceae bacterium]